MKQIASKTKLEAQITGYKYKQESTNNWKNIFQKLHRLIPVETNSEKIKNIYDLKSVIKNVELAAFNRNFIFYEGVLGI